MLISFVSKDHRSWDKYLGEFRFAYNTAHHDSLKTSPAFLNLGRHPKQINELKSKTDPPQKSNRETQICGKKECENYN